MFSGKILQAWQLQDKLWKLTCKTIVANIQLKQQLQVHKTLWNYTAKPVRVYVKQSKIIEQPQLVREVTGYVTVVDINTGHRTFRRDIRCRPTEDTSVVAYMGANPVASYVVGIRQHGLFPSLQCNVSILQSRVLEIEPWLGSQGVSIVGQEVSLLMRIIGEVQCTGGEIEEEVHCA